jgi:hypothetical protein
MIDIEYNQDGIKITTGELSRIFSREKLPLKLSIKKHISGETIWSTDLHDYMWASFPDTEMKDITISDKKGNIIKEYKWNVFDHGSIFYKSLWLYCRNLINEGKHPKGLAVGTHDGEFGEWVPVAEHHLSDILLVEGSRNQFEKLTKNFSGRKNLKFLFEIVTTNGEEVDFFEGGEGYTNSVVERVIKSWEKEEINNTKRSSISLNELIEKNGSNYDWFHFDVEGLDAKLLMSLKKENIPNFIIFEDFNLTDNERIDINKWISDYGFKSHSEGGICMITK